MSSTNTGPSEDLSEPSPEDGTKSDTIFPASTIIPRDKELLFDTENTPNTAGFGPDTTSTSWKDTSRIDTDILYPYTTTYLAPEVAGVGRDLSDVISMQQPAELRAPVVQEKYKKPVISDTNIDTSKSTGTNPTNQGDAQLNIHKESLEADNPETQFPDLHPDFVSYQTIEPYLEPWNIDTLDNVIDIHYAPNLQVNPSTIIVSEEHIIDEELNNPQMSDKTGTLYTKEPKTSSLNEHAESNQYQSSTKTKIELAPNLLVAGVNTPFYQQMSYDPNVLGSLGPFEPFGPFSINCFHSSTQILTNIGYRKIHELRPGDLIKTLKHGFVPINMIGKRDIYHPASQERIKDQLYECSSETYPELFENLVITGCHSLLVDSFISDDQRDQAIEVNNNRLCITDDKFRLPVCCDLRASIYQEIGYYTVYHFALDNDDYYMNYGVYANGLLVETCSKRFMKELSNMTLIE
jgi:hypothetical protein